MTTVTPSGGSDNHQAGHMDEHDTCSNAWDFAYRVSGDHSRAAWMLAFVVVILGAFVSVTLILAPYLGALGMLGGVGAGAGGAGIVELVRRRRRGRDDGQEDQE